jgi:sortase A
MTTSQAPLRQAAQPRGMLPDPRERRPRRALRLLAWALIFAGTLALLDAAVTLLWEEPLSALYAKLEQDHLESALHRVESAPPTAAERRALASLSDERRRIAFLARELERKTSDGGAIGRIVIPHIGVSSVVVKGTSTQDLEAGPGVYPETGFPGSGRTTAIAGHRTTFLAPFRHVDALRDGNRIRVRMPYAEFTYVVIAHRVVEPTDVQAAVGNVGYKRLVLSACTPLFSAAKRLLVFAHLVRTVPRGAARILPGGRVARPIEASTSGRRRGGQPAAGHGRLPAVLEPLDPRLLSPLV